MDLLLSANLSWGLAVLVHLVIVVVALIYIPRDRKPTAAMAWLLLIVILPGVGIILYLVIGNFRLPAKRRGEQARIDAMIRGNVADKQLEKVVPASPPGAAGASPGASGRVGPAEIDVDFVLHGSAEDGTAGPASRWAETCEPGESVVIIDEGLAFNPERGVDRVVLVADETGLPAVAGICATLPAGASGLAIVEVPSAEDALEFEHPAGITVRWVVREHGVKPGTLALQALRETALPDAPFHAYLVGEQALPADGRRHLVAERGVSKDHVSFCGYWRVGAASPAPKSQRTTEVHA